MNVLGFAMGNGAEGDVRIYFFEKRSMVLVVIQYAQMSCLNTYTDIFKCGAQWLSGRVLHLRPRGRRFQPHCVVVLEQGTFILA